MADKCADVINKEQLVICLRWVDENLQVHEDFLGLHPLIDTKADSIVKVIFDTIQRMGLKTENARGQCFDGVSTMAGIEWHCSKSKTNKRCCSVLSLLRPCPEPSRERLH